MVDDAQWKRRFHVFAAIRLFGLAMFFLGLGIAYSDLLRDGGWPAVGAIVAIIGVIDAVLAPRLLKKQWERADSK